MAELQKPLADVRFVKRIVVGSERPGLNRSAEEIQQAVALLNRCLGDFPRGELLGLEKGFTVIALGEAQVVQQFIAYHVGFARKPDWLD